MVETPIPIHRESELEKARVKAVDQAHIAALLAPTAFN